MDPFRYDSRFCDAIECDLCGGMFNPPCPFHADDSPVTVLRQGFWLWCHAIRRQRAEA